MKKIGMRVVKTGIGIYLALLISKWLQIDNGALAAVTVLVGMQPSLKGSMVSMKNQVIATIIGCFLATVISYYFSGSFIGVALAVIFAMWLCVNLKYLDSINLIAITIIIVGTAPSESFLDVMTDRVALILLGLMIAFGLNLLIRPKHEARLVDKVDQVRQEFESLYHDCIDDLTKDEFQEKEIIKERANGIKEGIQEARAIYTFSTESIIGYEEKKNKDEYFLIKRAINALASNLERLAEIHWSIIQAPNREEYRYIKLLLHHYLTSIFHYHQVIYQHVLFGHPLEERMLNRFEKEEKELERTILQMVNGISNLDPLHYYNILIEGERIMNKAWSLVEDKDRFEIAALVEDKDRFELVGVTESDNYLEGKRRG